MYTYHILLTLRDVLAAHTESCGGVVSALSAKLSGSEDSLADRFVRRARGRELDTEGAYVFAFGFLYELYCEGHDGAENACEVFNSLSLSAWKTAADSVISLNPVGFSCPCCGYVTLEEANVYEICPLCGWEDDPTQSRDEDFAGGANVLSLCDARRTLGESVG